MSQLVLERQLPASIEQVFEFVTKRDNLLKWWGPEGMTLPDEELDFTRLGPWHSVMMNADGKRFKVSGQVTSVDAPKRVAFTWAWHDEQDQRGHESHVMLDLSAHADQQTMLVLTHTQLPDDESRENHNMGWTSSFKKLERHFGLA